MSVETTIDFLSAAILVRLPHADKDRVKEAVERIYGGHALAWAAEPRGITAYPIDDEPVVITFEILRNL